MTQHEKKQAQSQSSQTQAQTQTAGVSTYRPASHNLANIMVSGKEGTYRRSQAAHPFYEADDQDRDS